ncbi:ankyrin repeat domain-containing protein [Caulobacter sp. 17J65-9]|uniref:ankyrin repeat domain-containing protein n=1 Tax=Caulobacter sp. 17J65-9 TaxID=2709382 RepID=UPI0013C6F73E|nr:ankyrin repeat domain-containing protein [Caulobacter sp. 17J65-9]NEX91507.1 ankyrin repeat domain-containing protein [Caulobacter sp. 17J65-9]
MIGILAALAMQGANPPKTAFDVERDAQNVAICASVYEQLRLSSGRLAARDARTEGVVHAFRGARRLAPFAKAAGVGPDADMPEALGVMLFTLVGDAQIERPKEDPHVVEAAVLSRFSSQCDRALDGWGAPAVTESPPDVIALGYAEHLVGGKTSADAFPDPHLAALARGTCEGDPAEIARALAAGADPNGRGLDGVTPLVWALTCENPVGMEALLKAGADPNRAVGDRGSVVFFAASYRDTGLLDLLLRYGGDPNARDERDTALMQALELGMHDAGWGNWDALLAAGADINLDVSDDDDFPRTIAISAAEFNQWGKVLELLKRGYSRDLDELGRHAESQDFDSSEVRAQKARVRQALERRGVKFPISAKKLWFKYKGMDGAARKADADAAVDLGRHYFTGHKDDGFEGEQVDLWYVAGDDVFVEEVDDEKSARNGAIQIPEERLWTHWRLSDEQIRAIRQAPESWTWTEFK